jgi:hypothetical protein
VKSTASTAVATSAPIRVPKIRLTVRTKTDAYSGRTMTAVVSGSQNAWVGCRMTAVSAVATAMHRPMRTPSARQVCEVAARINADKPRLSGVGDPGRFGCGLSASASSIKPGSSPASNSENGTETGTASQICCPA